jgi:flagellar hook-associated protein 2
MTTGPTVQLGNFYSSFDTGSVLEKLRAAREIPLQALDTQQQQLQQRQQTMTSLTTRFTSLLSRANSLFDSASISKKSAFVSGLGVSAAAGPNATPGSFTVAVTKLASGTAAVGTPLTAAVDAASMLASSNFGTAPTAGTFTMKAASGASTTITIDPTTQSLTDVITAINAQTGTSGITATLVNDSNGRPNILHLESSMGDIQLGAGADTSNFLAATNLLAAPGTTARESTLQIASINLGAKMATASFLGGPPAAGAHSFTVNGATINYDASLDSMNDVINRINSSSAGVTASYDVITDKITITQSKQGSIALSLADDGTGGDFLAKTGLLSATQALGANAEYSINGGATQYATSNTVTLSGDVTLTLTALTNGSPATVTVSQDTNSALANMQNFVTDFNSLYQALSDATKADKDNPGPMSGDSSLLMLKSQLRSVVGGFALNPTGRYTDLGALGLSFGAVGSAVGTTNTLVLDATKFTTALANDPVSAQAALSGLTFSAVLAPGGTSSASALSGTYAGTKSGSYQLIDDGAGNVTSVFTPSDGSAQTTTLATITAGGTNTTLIPGMTLTFGALQGGTSTINVTRASASVVSLIKDFLDGQVGANGTLTKRQDEFTAISKDIDARRIQIQASVDAEMALWQKKFTAMEQAQAAASSISAQLTSAFAKSNSD